MSWRWWCGALAVLVLAACSSSPDDAVAPTDAPIVATSGGAASPAPAPTSPASTPVSGAEMPSRTAAAGVAPVGFDLVAARVTAADGATCDVCLWLAATPAARTQGLMGVTDLSGADGMVFRWDEPTSGNFWMRDTPLPLSIAFFDADGSFVSANDMAPCLAPTPDAECARYDAAGPYQYAVEVALGGLADLLMAPGSRLELLAGGCPSSP